MCGKAFAVKYSLTKHEHIHNKVSGKELLQVSGLAQHEMEQSSDKEYTCEICSGVFMKKERLTKHFLAHEATDWYQFLKKVYECWRCEKYFALREDMVEHHQQYHKG